MLQRLNPFWLGAGGFLTLFCVNEIIAYHQSPAPVWLGGPLSYAGMVVGSALGVGIMFFLGIEEPPERSSSADDDEDDDEDSDDPDEAAGNDGAASPR